jgi:high-affinity iron transporter
MRTIIIRYLLFLHGVAMFATLLITFREGLEALLMVAVATLYLRKTARQSLVSGVRAGLALSVAGSAALGVALADVGAMSPAWEGLLALLAAAAVVWCVTHMLKVGRHLGADISASLGRATVLDGAQAWWAVFGFTVFMVGREGIETATMLAALAGQAQPLGLLLGGLGGLTLAAGVSWAWVRFGREVNLSRFFNVTAVFMLAFSALLLLKAFFEFTEVGLVPGIDNAHWHGLTEAWVEGSYAQLASVALVAAPSLWLVAATLRDRRKLQAA